MAGGKGGNLGKASLVLTTKDGGLNRGLGKAQGGITSWANSVKGRIAGALGVVSGLIAGFTSSKIVGNIGDLSAVGKQAEALGIATDTFMGLGAAAKEAGIEQEQFGSLLQKAQVRIAEGSDETQAALGRLGLSVQQLRGRAPDQIFFAVAAGMQRVADRGTRAFIATKLFEEEGVKLLPVLARGEQGLRDYIAQMRAWGVALDANDMQKVQLAQRIITRVELRARGFFNRMTVAAAPFLEKVGEIADELENWLPPLAKIEAGAVPLFKILAYSGAAAYEGMAFASNLFNASAAAGVVTLGYMVEGLKEVALLSGRMLGKVGGPFVGLGNNLGNIEGHLKFGGAAMMNDAKEGLRNAGQMWGRVEKLFAKLDEVKPIPVDGRNVLQAIDIGADRLGEKFAAAIERGTVEDYQARIRFNDGRNSRIDEQLWEQRKTAANTAVAAEKLKEIAVKFVPVPGVVLKPI